MLTSLQNSLVKQIRKLHTAKYRRQQCLMLLEGTHLVQEAVTVGLPIDTLCYTPEWQEKTQALLQQLQPQALRCELVSPEVLQAIATTMHPDGVIAVVPSPQQAAFTIQQFGLVLETIQDPGNAGTILRTAAAAGVEGVLLSADSVDLESPKVLRASAGAWFRVATACYADLPTQVKTYRTQGFQVVATSPQGDLDYWSVDYTRPTLLMVGNEGAGLSEALMQAADLRVAIPLSAGVDSLNAAIATAIILYEAKRQRAQREGRL